MQRELQTREGCSGAGFPRMETWGTTRGNLLRGEALKAAISGLPAELHLHLRDTSQQPHGCAKPAELQRAFSPPRGFLAIKNAAICIPAQRLSTPAVLHSCTPSPPGFPGKLSGCQHQNSFPFSQAVMLCQNPLFQPHTFHIYFKCGLKGRRGTGHKYSFPVLLPEPGNTQRSGMAPVGWLCGTDLCSPRWLFHHPKCVCTPGCVNPPLAGKVLGSREDLAPLLALPIFSYFLFPPWLCACSGTWVQNKPCHFVMKQPFPSHFSYMTRNLDVTECKFGNLLSLQPLQAQTWNGDPSQQLWLNSTFCLAQEVYVALHVPCCPHGVGLLPATRCILCFQHMASITVPLP
ncbi:uncharacterized protein LOC128814871 [Vidua macroura]|uniref:uncharacterized protein LOC128814871 n=1 Tax=Vidua macroura TaxID=187451 RepID=UPI0023A7F7F7|nr:uncharacterized protein LOC128814871 [Vidua macroura]XP_053847139.1 uncharacterized protein LOC128814871 [Vidua macroura]